MFCVSNAQGKHFAMLLACGGCIFLLSAVKLTRKTLPMQGKFARTRSACCCGSFAVPCSGHANATSLFGDFLALVLLPVGSALSRQTCDAEFVANAASSKNKR
eukprot:3213557-Amphidinium_carterae.1